jgi:hypothetical protein
MIVQRMRNIRAAARVAAPALAAMALVTGLAAAAPASAATTPFAFLAGVECTNSTACIAVGGRAGHDQRDTIFNLSWNGQRWTPQVPVDGNHTQPNDLNSVACTSATQCFAVGSVGNFNYADHRLLIEAWNGTAWSILAFGNPAGTANTFLESISCGGPALCFATGEKNDNTGMQPGVVLEKWNGTAWSVQPALPEPSGALGIGMHGVSCVSSTDCTGVGESYTPQFQQSTLAEHWNGQQWSIEPTPALGSGDQPFLNTVSCSGATCIATGVDFTTTGVQPLAEWFNGTSWSVTHLATPAGATNLVVNGVDCTSAANCYAVGSSSASGGTAVSLIEQWSGTSWAVVSSPNTHVNDVLQGVSCVSAQSCIAVGQSGSPDGTELFTLAMRLSGGRWSITPTPSPG